VKLVEVALSVLDDDEAVGCGMRSPEQKEAATPGEAEGGVVEAADVGSNRR
jgi:hypothetical protein